MRLSTPVVLVTALLLFALGACDDPPASPESAPDPVTVEARGGIPGRPSALGPPPHVILPEIGPQGGLPAVVPPGAGPPGFLTNIVEVGAGGVFTCALRDDGVVFCWGSNSGGLGDGSPSASSVPVQVATSRRFARLFVGAGTACALTDAGEAYCWGGNTDGELGAGLQDRRSLVPVPVAGGHSFLGLDVGLRNVCGVAADGLTYCWGGGTGLVMAPTAAGTKSDVPSPIAASAALGFVEVSVGFFHACGIDAAGTAHCWGDRGYAGNGETGTASTPEPAASGLTFSAFAVGSGNTCGLDPAGDAYCWGQFNQWGQIGQGTFDTPVPTPAAVSGGLAFRSTDANDNNTVAGHGCALTPEGEAWCWGNNDWGQLGVSGGEPCGFSGNSQCFPAPVRVSGGLSFEAVSVGGAHSCALAIDRTVWCWGGNGGGQLGDGSMVDSATPVAVRGLDVDPVAAYVRVTPFDTEIRLLGLTEQLTAEAFDLDGIPLPTQPTFEWASSDPSVATVDAAGVVTAVSGGTVTITATTPDGVSGRVDVVVDPIDPVASFKGAIVGAPFDIAVGNRVTGKEGVTVWSGLMTDEFAHTGTFPTRQAVDRRDVTSATAGVGVEGTYLLLDDARRALEWDAARLAAADPTDPTPGRYRMLAGFTYLAFAENWCSGVPVDDPDVGLSSTELFDRARARFEAALGGPLDPADATAARIGIARARLGVGQFAEAASAVADVPTGFVRPTTHGPGQPGNGIADLFDQRRLSVADVEGSVGLAFRNPVDTRVPWVADGVGFDRVSPFYRLLKYPSASSDFPLATGIEARLIEAEAHLAAGDETAFLGVLNQLRSFGGLPALTDPGSGTPQVDLLFRERALWLYATGHRLGDVRRLIGLYGRAPETVLPGGAYPKGGSYGTEANLPVPAVARGPGFSGCTDRSR